MEMEITFPGGKQVDARFGPHRVVTDQPTEAGGRGVAPSPFDLFLASLGTCAGYYALGFCRERGLPVAGLGLVVRFDRGADGKSIAAVRAELTLPPGFPDKYHAAIARAVGQCAVKRHLDAPPAFAVEVVPSAAIPHVA
jgi:ribosomal protein S12 methylthiotransferase accessory factor